MLYYGANILSKISMNISNKILVGQSLKRVVIIFGYDVIIWIKVLWHVGGDCIRAGTIRRYSKKSTARNQTARRNECGCQGTEAGT